MSEIPAMLAAGHTMKEQLDDLIFRAKVADSGEARVAASLYLTIAEQFAATLHLIEGGFSSHAPIMVRSMLEGLAGLLNLAKTPSYLEQMRYDNARSDVILFDEYAADSSMQNDEDAIATLKAWKEKALPIRDELKANGYQKQDVIEKFRLAGILPSYVAYRVFCSFAHNQLTALISRHVGNFELRYHDQAPEAMTTSLLSVAVSIVCQAVNVLPNFTDLDEAELKNKLDDMDQTWTSVRNERQ